MSSGSYEREHPRDVQCQHCGRFYRNDGIQGHESNCPYSEVDDTIVDLADEGDRDTTPSDAGGDVNPPQDDEGMGDDPPTETVTDGGPQSPPAADVDVVEDDQDDDQNDDDLPDRYVDVAEYVDAVEQETDGTVDTDELRRRLAPYDVVDVEATTAENIVAFERSEVTR